MYQVEVYGSLAEGWKWMYRSFHADQAARYVRKAQKHGDTRAYRVTHITLEHAGY